MNITSTSIFIPVENLDSSMEEYKGIFPFNYAWTGMGMEFADFQAGESKVLLVSRSALANLMKEYHLLDYYQEGVPIFSVNVENVHSTYEEFKVKGGLDFSTLTDIVEWKVKTFMFRDTNGHIMQICEQYE